MGVARRVRLLLAIALVLAGSGVQSEVYRWTDSQGRVHFGDRPDAAAAQGAKKVLVPRPNRYPNPALPRNGKTAVRRSGPRFEPARNVLPPAANTSAGVAEETTPAVCSARTCRCPGAEVRPPWPAQSAASRRWRPISRRRPRWRTARRR
ncbi:MAG: DUF4124 domain-containing protein [Hydrogenophaga sp.]|uniref:DUF4124 domain-containing protein n=1 Tax=Hydrogenophaga sp. TaxID=1904254 RepID=UPI0016A28CAE|nr:DUF4124 domain-containing protein [Hydrogenophaga sp.]NIN25340.1 DUF4124 domain-containing protein [Hydrogenophaga sp.]NIN32197.1 DUF4124 domain-containing protein [Hydrogenophaga sp.]NIN56446.1 DUF4124 domain-containing protein [Hydrogenophaga sp.]NIO52755.1 DUF4124 domain-containing protein [Hydrogenophaga sp.]